MELWGLTFDSQLVMESYAVSVTTALLLLALEASLWSSQWSRRLKEEKNLKELYAQGVWSNLGHFVVVGPMAYALVSAYVKASGYYYPDWISVPGVLGVQGVGYAYAHKWMHKSENYWIHKFHHSFNHSTFVRPVTANSRKVQRWMLKNEDPEVVKTETVYQCASLWWRTAYQ